MPPYRKRYTKRSYGRSRSTSRRRRPMGGSFMKRARTRAYANLRTGGLLAIERKFHDVGFPLTGLGFGGSTGVANNTPSGFAPGVQAPTSYRSATGTIFTVNPTALNVLVAGDSGSDRDGRQVINDSVHLRGHVVASNSENHSVNSFTPAIVNIVLVLDTQTNGAGPASGALVFVNPGDFTGVGQSSAGDPFLNLSNSKRFRILKHIRRQVAWDSSYVDPGDSTIRVCGGFAWSMDVPLKGMKTNYVSDASAITGATVSSIGDNGLFLFAWSNKPSNQLAVGFNSRLRFRG